ncbi:glycosyltransferase family 2 protein [Lysobacter sp. cf310]|uniref:glycosyltransferase family 2 protein n=1 Tax=Lysobacter sp. cf310 TaxID=1761790 RepID=UPI0008F146EA|nr:glycosyltransferase family 2 protein [Lysobacter sp. cf310]SFL27781.1 Glycosyltransferase, GT2 family [Lysobacter sp. cf310]
MRLDLVPLKQLSATRSGDAWDCHAQGEDPQFDVRAQAGSGLPAPGWYLLDLRCSVREGAIVAPCFYPDYGKGQSEANRIEIAEPVDGQRRVRTVVLINAALRALRYDPTQCEAAFALKGFRLRRISRPRAVWEMLRGIQRSSRRLFSDEALSALRDFARSIARGRAAEAAEDLKQRYRAALRRKTYSYQQWIARFDRSFGRRERAELEAGAPLFSIVLPVRDTPLPWLRRCIDSVLAQTYARWQLCIVDDASNDPAVKKLLRDYAMRDRRICVQFRERHGHICEASNDAIDLARGNYLGFLDHDDELSERALAEVARAIGEHADAQLLYSDEDKIDRDGRRYDPHFKPAWNPELLCAQNYICHFAVIRADLVRAVGRLRPGFEGAQDHDLVLRCVERLRDEQIVHIPKVLYHWRAVQGSTAMGGDHKPYALEAGRRAVDEHLARMGRPSRVEVTPHQYYRPIRRLGAESPRVTVIVPTRDRVDLLRKCVESVLARTEYPDFELMVIDNGSIHAETLSYLDELRARPRLRVVEYPQPFNFSAIVNYGVRQGAAEVLCLLNNDTEVIDAHWLSELVSYAARDEVGAVGCMLYYPSDTIQHAGVILGVGGVAGHAHLHLQRGSNGYLGRAGVVHNLTAVTGACLAVRRCVFDEAGGMDEELAVAFNDIDLCLRIDALGYRNVWTPFAELYHHESASRGLDSAPDKRARFQVECETMIRRWGEVLFNDPAYNPNLSLDSFHFELAFPPRSVASRAPQGRRRPLSRIASL